MVAVGVDGEAAAGEEFAPDFDVPGMEEVDQVVHDDIYAVFMEVTVIAEAEEVELQGFTFYHEISGDVGDVDGGKIGLPCLRAETGKFGTIETHPIIIPGVLVNKRLQHLRSIILLVFRLLS